jgi:hypothetical protein
MYPQIFPFYQYVFHYEESYTTLHWELEYVISIMHYSGYNRYLYIPLMMAERAWSYAMQLRQEANTEPRKKFHLISRLRKATTHSLQLQTLCEVTFCFPA